MTESEIQAVIDRVGRNNFDQAVRSLIDGDDFSMEVLANNWPAKSQIRQEVRKAIRWVADNGRPTK